MISLSYILMSLLYDVNFYFVLLHYIMKSLHYANIIALHYDVTLLSYYLVTLCKHNYIPLGYHCIMLA